MGLLADIGRSGIGEDMVGLWNAESRNRRADEQLAMNQQAIDEAKRRTSVAEQMVEKKARTAMFQSAINSKQWKMAEAMWPTLQKDYPELGGITFEVGKDSDGPVIRGVPRSDGTMIDFYQKGDGWQPVPEKKPPEKKPPTKITYHEGDTEKTEFYENGELTKAVEAPRYKPQSGEMTPQEKRREEAERRREQNSLSKEYTSRIASLKKEYYDRKVKATQDPEKYKPMDNAEWNERLNGIYDEFSPRFESAGITEWKGNARKQQKEAAKQLDEATAKAILTEAGGDKNKAREIAKQRGYTF